MGSITPHYSSWPLEHCQVTSASLWHPLVGVGFCWCLNTLIVCAIVRHSFWTFTAPVLRLAVFPQILVVFTGEWIPKPRHQFTAVLFFLCLLSWWSTEIHACIMAHVHSRVPKYLHMKPSVSISSWLSDHSEVSDHGWLPLAYLTSLALSVRTGLGDLFTISSQIQIARWPSVSYFALATHHLSTLYSVDWHHPEVWRQLARGDFCSDRLPNTT